MEYKPQNIRTKEYFIKKLAINLVISEKIIDAVIVNQYDSAYEATNNCNSIEISGFGKFLFNTKKALKQMEKYKAQKQMYETELLDESLTDIKRKNFEDRLKTTLYNIKHLKPKLREDVQDK